MSVMNKNDIMEKIMKELLTRNQKVLKLLYTFLGNIFIGYCRRLKT